MRFFVSTGLSVLLLCSLVQGQVQVTVYNHGQALIKESFTAVLKQGESLVQREDVAEKLIPSSVKLQSTRGSTTVLEQNFQYDLVDQNRLLKKYLSAEVNVLQQNGDKLTGELLSFDGSSLVIRSRTGIEIIQRSFVGSVRCPEPREKLYVHPTLEWRLASEKPGEETLDFSYLTGGMSWQAEYVAILGDAEKSLNISSWINLKNESGAVYDNAHLKLVAGELNRARKARGPQAREAVTVMRKADQFQVEERGLFEYHIYDVSFPVTLRNREEKQIQWLSPQEVQAEKHFVFENGNNEFQPVRVQVTFRNDEKTGTGVPLPQGTVRLFKRDTDGALELVGEDWLEHTSRDDEVNLVLGKAFDVKGKQEVTDRRLRQDRYREEDVRITLNNRKSEKVSVDVIENLGWANWEIRNATGPYEKLDARRARFRVSVPAESEQVVSYTYFQSYK